CLKSVHCSTTIDCLNVSVDTRGMRPTLSRRFIPRLTGRKPGRLPVCLPSCKLLGIYPYAPLKMLLLDPHLPAWLPEITIATCTSVEPRPPYASIVKAIALT